GSMSSPNNNLPRIAAGEWGSTPSTREAKLSTTACDWTPDFIFPGASSSGTSVTVPFAVGGGANFGFYPVAPLNTTMYFNVKNTANSGCAASGVCDMFVDLTRPGALAGAASVTAKNAEVSVIPGAKIAGNPRFCYVGGVPCSSAVADPKKA